MSLILIPLADRGPERQLRKRPVVAAVGLTFFVGYVVLFAAGRIIGSVPPSADLRQPDAGALTVPARPSVPLAEPGLPEVPGDESGGGAR